MMLLSMLLPLATTIQQSTWENGIDRNGGQEALRGDRGCHARDTGTLSSLEAILHMAKQLQPYIGMHFA